MLIIPGGKAAGARSEQRSSTFTGLVWADPVLQQSDGVNVNNVFFSPGARTFWHRHEGGQVLHVTGGEGWVCARGEEAGRVRSGDIVWTPPGEQHWHGAADTHYLLHLAVSLGVTAWDEEVADDDHRVRGAARDACSPIHHLPHDERRFLVATGSDQNAAFREGLRVRREVLGAEHVDRSLQRVTEFSRPVQEWVTECGWGAVWTRPGLDRRTRSLLNLVMLTALNRMHEFGVHVRGAVTNGCTDEDIKEALLQAALYCGAPAALESFRVAERVLDEVRSSD